MNKQIEEMAKIIHEAKMNDIIAKVTGDIEDLIDCPPMNVSVAEALYNAGYRKASDVAREIFAELETVLYKIVKPSIRAVGIVETKIMDGFHIRIEDYNTIKKKYESEGED